MNFCVIDKSNSTPTPENNFKFVQKMPIFVQTIESCHKFISNDKFGLKKDRNLWFVYFNLFYSCY